MLAEYCQSVNKRLWGRHSCQKLGQGNILLPSFFLYHTGSAQYIFQHLFFFLQISPPFSFGRSGEVNWKDYRSLLLATRNVEAKELPILKRTYFARERGTCYHIKPVQSAGRQGNASQNLHVHPVHRHLCHKQTKGVCAYIYVHNNVL